MLDTSLPSSIGRMTLCGSSLQDEKRDQLSFASDVSRNSSRAVNANTFLRVSDVLRREAGRWQEPSQAVVYGNQR